MQIKIELDEQAVREIITEYLSNQVGTTIDVDDVTIEVKSKHNWRAEWEKAHFRATYHSVTTGKKL